MFYLEQVEVASMILCAGIVLVAHTSKLQPEAQLLQAVIDREIVSGGMVEEHHGLVEAEQPLFDVEVHTHGSLHGGFADGSGKGQARATI